MKHNTKELDPRFDYGVRAQEIDAQLTDEIVAASNAIRRLVFLSKMAELITEHACSGNGYDQSEGDFALALLERWRNADNIEQTIDAFDGCLSDQGTFRAAITAAMETRR